MLPQQIKLLLVDDQEDDYFIFKDIVDQIRPINIKVYWVETIDEALRRLSQSAFDVCFVDYRLRMQTGLDLLHAMDKDANACPVIMLTGQGDYDIDIKAMREGASDYLEKGQLTPALLERSIRYAVERMRIIASLRKSEHRLRVISAKLIHAQEEERKRIARELHDNIGSCLTGIKLGLETVIRNPAQTDALPDMVAIVQNAIQDLRGIYSDIRPALLDELGIIQTIHWYCRKLDRISPDTHIDIRIGLVESDIPHVLKIILFRILQESLNNIAKHSGASLIGICLEKRADTIVFEIADNGAGFDVAAALESDAESTGMGLESMKERTEYIGGTFDITSKIGQGTTIRIAWKISLLSALIDRDGRRS